MALHPEANAPFQVVATGHPLPEHSADGVRARLERQFKLPAATAARLLAGTPVVLKRAATQALADAYCARLRGAGLAVEVVATSPAAAAPATTAQPSATTGTASAAEPALHYFADGAPSADLVPVSLRLRLWPQTLQLLATPLLYGLLVLLAAGALLAFAIHGWLRTAPLFFSLPVYLLPLLAGLTVLAALLRPLLPPQRRPDTSVPTSEPQLRALVAQICARLGAAPPDAIRVDLGTGAAVRLAPGRDGWQRGRYTLRVGLPLIQNAALPTLAAALAAQLVFAREPALLRRHAIAVRVRGWLQSQASMAPDRLSQWLAARPAAPVCAWLRRAERWTRPRLGALFAALARRSSRAAECTLLQIGDRAGVALADADAVAARLLTGYRLEHARQRAQQQNAERRSDRRPVDDLAPLIAFFHARPDAAHERHIARALETGAAAQAGGTGDRERIARAGRIAAEFSAPRPPTGAVLLAAADQLGRACTEALYAADGVAAGARLPVERRLDDALLDLEQAEAGAAYFNGWLVPARGWRLPDLELLRDMPHADARLQLNVCVNEVRRLSPDRARLLHEFARLQNQLDELLLGQQVLAAGHRFQFRYLQYDGTSLAPLIEQRQRDLANIIEQLATQESIMGGRIALGLKLFGQDGAESEALHRTLHFLGEQEKALYRLEQDTALLERLLQRRREYRERGHADAIARLTDKVRDATLRLLDKVKGAPEPPDRRYAPLRDFFADGDSGEQRDQAAQAASHARSVLDGFYTLNEKLSLLAAEQASSVEAAYRIERIRLVGEDA